jgi:outer membrane immunogenic protein
MKIHALAITALGGFCLASGEAEAADVRPPPPTPDLLAPTPVYNWTGFYVGAFVGGAHGMWTVDFFRNNNHGHAEEGADGVAGGGWVGYNYQFANRFVIGIEGDVGVTSAKQSNNIFDNDTSLAEFGAFGSIRGRVGYAFDRLLLYGTLGYGFANVTNEIQKGRNAGEQVVFDDQTQWGWYIGGGAEYAFAPQWIGRLEYLYSNYGTVVLFNRDGNRAEFTNALHQLRVGLSYRF